MIIPSVDPNSPPEIIPICACQNADPVVGDPLSRSSKTDVSRLAAPTRCNPPRTSQPPFLALGDCRRNGWLSAWPVGWVDAAGFVAHSSSPHQAFAVGWRRRELESAGISLAGGSRKADSLASNFRASAVCESAASLAVSRSSVDSVSRSESSMPLIWCAISASGLCAVLSDARVCSSCEMVTRFAAAALSEPVTTAREKSATHRHISVLNPASACEGLAVGSICRR